LLSLLEPRPARGVGAGKHKLTGVYASPQRAYAIAFALPILPNAKGELAWTVKFEAEFPKIRVKAGALQEDGIGYVYRLATAPFQELDELQWITYETVIPVGHEVIQAKDFLAWIEYL
jgi:hypothetical protein